MCQEVKEQPVCAKCDDKGTAHTIIKRCDQAHSTGKAGECGLGIVPHVGDPDIVTSVRSGEIWCPRCQDEYETEMANKEISTYDTCGDYVWY